MLETRITKVKQVEREPDVNKLLEEGWILISTHTRTEMGPDANYPVIYSVVYVLGKPEE